MRHNDEDTTCKQNKNSKTRGVESLKVLPSTAGYITLVTTSINEGDAIFEPCPNNPEARILCLGIVKLRRLGSENRAIFRVSYLNVEIEQIEIEEGKTLGTRN